MDDLMVDRITARATAFGFGLIAFMVTWLVAAVTTEHMMEPPNSAYVAMMTAVIAGAAVTASLSRRLVNQTEREFRRGRQIDRGQDGPTSRTEEDERRKEGRRHSGHRQ